VPQASVTTALYRERKYMKKNKDDIINGWIEKLTGILKLLKENSKYQIR